ncbi:MAG: GGDEF domain-containing protein [Ruminococcus sp.]|nr:GGDEF domain-containing protein [Ruminococcus sp.]
MNNKDRSPISFARLALALANDYSTIYVINTEDDSYIEYSPSGADKELIQVSSGKNFYEAVPKNCREQVYKDDQEYFLEAFKKSSVTQALEDGRSFSLTYRLIIDGMPRYFFLKTIRSDDRSIVIGVRDIDAEKRKSLETEETGRTYAEIAKSLASLFEIIYHIDLETGRYTEYSSSEAFSKQGFSADGEDFFARARMDMERVVHPEERETIIHELERDVIINNLRRQGTVSLTYRQLVDNTYQYVNLLAFIQNTDKDHLVIGVRNIDAEKKRESESLTYAQIAGALASRYEVIYYIDADTDEYTQYSDSEQYAKLGITTVGDDFFADASKNIREYIHPEDMPRILDKIDKKKLLRKLEKSGFTSMSFRQFLDGRYQYMNMQAVRPKNDIHHIIMGVINVDAQTQNEMSIKAENQTFSDISVALAIPYEVIYHVNIVTNEYVEYSSSEEYKKLKVNTTGKNFFAESHENMKRKVFPDDLEMMSEAMQKDNLIGKLTSKGKFFINYRLIMDGRPQYVSLYAVRPKEDSEHIIIAIANIDEAKRTEMEYQELANHDALTGVKNKRAYVQAETELDGQISKSTHPPFAIVVCDINGLKQVNDTKGHNAGDEFIKNACSIICNIFKHSPVFRIGGDEFIVIMKGSDYDERTKLMHELNNTLELKKYEGIPVLAAGMSEFDPDMDMRVQDVFERADNLMYENKKKSKALVNKE